MFVLFIEFENENIEFLINTSVLRNNFTYIVTYIMV